MTAGGLKAVFLSERRMLVRLLTGRLRDADLAEEVLQELWIKLESMPSGPIADPAAYLYRMANNLAFDRRRSEARRSAREGVWLDTQDEVVEASAERTMIARERLDQLKAALGALPERTALIFRRWRAAPRYRAGRRDQRQRSGEASAARLSRDPRSFRKMTGMGAFEVWSLNFCDVWDAKG